MPSIQSGSTSTRPFFPSFVTNGVSCVTKKGRSQTGQSESNEGSTSRVEGGGQSTLIGEMGELCGSLIGWQLKQSEPSVGTCHDRGRNWLVQLVVIVTLEEEDPGSGGQIVSISWWGCCACGGVATLRAVSDGFVGSGRLCFIGLAASSG